MGGGNPASDTSYKLHMPEGASTTMSKRTYVVCARHIGGRHGNGSTDKCHKCGAEIKLGDMVVTRPTRSRRLRYHAKCWRKAHI